MFIGLEDGTPLRGDIIIKAVQRFDLTPVPSTLELSLRLDASADGKFKPGALLLAGAARDRYRIVKATAAPSQWVQGGDQAAQAVQVIAMLDGFSALAWPLARAVVKERASLGEVYRACGASVRIAADVHTQRFACYAGQLATPGLAQLLQEEGAAAVWAKGRLSFIRLPDLFTGHPVDSVQTDATVAVDSPFLERHQVPWAMSTDPAGAAVLGRNDTPRGFVYLPRTPERVLNNMTRYLAVRRVMPTNYAGHILAGDGIDIAGKRHIVVTVAHSWDTGSGGGGANQVSRVWLAELVK